MRIKDVIRGSKTDLVCDAWNTSRMPKTVFPLGKSGKHALSLGASFQWCLIRFRSHGDSFRVLVAVDFDKQQYYAHLGQEQGGDMQMLSSYEYHATHGGWHVHAGCGDMTLIPYGRYKGPWKRNIPKDWTTCRQMLWDVSTLDDALKKACDVYGLTIPHADDAGTQIPLL